MSFEPTEDTGGFDLNNTALTFGKVPRGSSSMRNMAFDNNYDFPVRVVVNVNGAISPYISYPKEIIFEPHEKGKIPFTIMENSVDCVTPRENSPDRDFGIKSNKTNQNLCNLPFGIENGSYDGFARVYVYKLR